MIIKNSPKFRGVNDIRFGVKSHNSVLTFSLVLLSSAFIIKRFPTDD